MNKINNADSSKTKDLMIIYDMIIYDMQSTTLKPKIKHHNIATTINKLKHN